MLRRSTTKPTSLKACSLCGAIVPHAAIVVADLNKDGVLDERDEVWAPMHKHLAPCGQVCINDISRRMPTPNDHGFKGHCPKCGDLAK